MKSDEMNNTIFEVFGIDINKCITNKTCAICKCQVGEFRDTLSEKEFEISGMCQDCQDSIFGGEDEEDELSL